MKIPQTLQAAIRGALAGAIVSATIYAVWRYYSSESFTRAEIPWSHGVKISPWWDIVSYALTAGSISALFSLLPPTTNVHEQTERSLQFCFVVVVIFLVWMGLSIFASSTIPRGEIALNAILLLPSAALTVVGFIALILGLGLIGACCKWIVTGKFSV